ncbi:hypothetical protein OE494_33315, partial [Pseudomonas aeruginosa]|nr:hypothetical protein [Pseudomonas aeruginosa]
MKLLVVFAGADQEVFWPVVGADAVDVVDDFAIAEPSPESLFGDKDMLVAPLLAANMHNHISGFLDGSIAYGSLGEDVVAGWRTFSRTLLGRVVLPPG